MSITALNNYAIGDVNFNTMMTTLDKTFKGKADITISEYDTDSAPDVKVGSVFENNGSLFIVDSTDITPTGYSGISVSTTFYLYYDESATAFIYSSTAPTWSDALQGWYNGNDRAFFSMYKDSGGTLYESKNKLLQENVHKGNYLHLQDQKASGTGGGTFTQDVWQIRILNTEITNTIPGALLNTGTNVITLPKGIYLFNIIANAYDVLGHKVRLYNITDSSIESYGTSAYATTGVDNSASNQSFLKKIVTITSEKTFRIEHRCNVTKAVYGFGISVNLGTEIYLDCLIEKVG